MIDIIFPFSIDKELLYKFLLENGFDNRFSIKQKVYYNLVRPIIPVNIRQLLQEKLNNKIEWKKDFIDDTLVKKILKLSNDGLTKFRYRYGKECAIVLTHDVEEQNGFNFIPKIIKLEEKYGFKSAWNIVPYKYNITDDIINEIRNNGNEIGIHGYNHDGKLYYSKKIFDKRAIYINEAIEKYGAVGFRSPMVHRNLEWLQQLNILYDASCFDYDPFQPFPGGTGCIWPFIAGKFVELPYTLPQDHTLFYVLKVKDISIWKNKIDWLVNHHGMILVLTHPDYLREKDHLKYYEELLAYLSEIKNTWRCLPKEIAMWWSLKFPNKNG